MIKKARTATQYETAVCVYIPLGILEAVDNRAVECKVSRSRYISHILSEALDMDAEVRVLGRPGPSQSVVNLRDTFPRDKVKYFPQVETGETKASPEAPVEIPPTPDEVEERVKTRDKPPVQALTENDVNVVELDEYGEPI